MSQRLERVKNKLSISRFKPSESTSSKVQSWTVRDSRPSRNHMTNNKLLVLSLGLFCIPTITLLFNISITAGLGIGISNVSAEPYALSISFVDKNSNTDTSTNTTTTPNLELNVSPSSTGGFAKSNTKTIGVGTTNANGYTIGIASTSDNTNVSSRLFLNGDSSSSDYLSSITTDIDEDTFKALGNTSYNNMWGYLPSKWDGHANNRFLPAPDKDGDVLNSTTAANTVLSSTATDTCKRYQCDTYDLTIGARVDATQKIGAYTNTYVIYTTANGTPYTITYKDDTIANMPADESSNSASTTVNISTQIPTRDGYTFIGWCTVKPTVNSNGTDSCSGTTYNEGGNNSEKMTWTITSGANTNNLTLYAMWSGNYTIGSVTTMQEFSTMTPDKKAKVIASMTTDQQYQLKDTRDDNVYWVAKLKDGNVWMTQGLDLDLKNGTVLEHTKSDIGWTETKRTKTWDPATTANTISFEGGSGTSVSGWGDNSYNSPYSASIYYESSDNDVYILPSANANVDTVADLLYCETKMSESECSHYKLGNYYNFAAATATNSVDDTVGHKVTNDDGYTVMPDSICPAGWRLPRGITGAVANGVASIYNSEFDTLFYSYRITSPVGATLRQTTSGSSSGIRATPLYFLRSGYVSVNGTLTQIASYGGAYSSTIVNAGSSYGLDFRSYIIPNWDNDRRAGFPVRCVVR